MNEPIQPKRNGHYTRTWMVGALTLLRADETQREHWSYVVLAEELRRISATPARRGRKKRS